MWLRQNDTQPLGGSHVAGVDNARFDESVDSVSGDSVAWHVEARSFIAVGLGYGRVSTNVLMRDGRRLMTTGSQEAKTKTGMDYKGKKNCSVVGGVDMQTPRGINIELLKQLIECVQSVTRVCDWRNIIRGV
jgi:hypothetical protein